MSVSVYVPTDNEIETFTGNYVDTRNPDWATITVTDIAHALSSVCRYGGHCRRFYSVAEHAVFVSVRLERKGYDWDTVFGGLHHDDPEAYLGDIPRPLKPLLGKSYELLTNKMEAAIMKSLDLPNITKEQYLQIKEADNWALFVEARHLLPSQGKGWWDGGQSSQTWGIETLPSRIITPDYWKGGLPPEAAEHLFLARHRELLERKD
jgi:hypothetical protein